MYEDKLQEITPEQLQEMEEMDKRDADIDEQALMMAKLQEQIEELRRETEQAKFRAWRAEQKEKCVPTQIGGFSTSGPAVHLSPSELDIKVEPWSTSPCGTTTYVAWFPILVWPMPIRHTNGQFTNYLLGRTVVRESLATVDLPQPDGTTHSVSITGFASLQLAMKREEDGKLTPISPEEMAERITQREQRSASYGSNSAAPHGQSTQEEDEPEQPAFIPSEQLDQ
ncbi:MAG: hypothetical protein D6812_02905 [Deltaproteobacteria bacterium]|nr:MAG: hypothetical protein D6812_02905 [Deltaproteobacteria bacterium]